MEEAQSAGLAVVLDFLEQLVQLFDLDLCTMSRQQFAELLPIELVHPDQGPVHVLDLGEFGGTTKLLGASRGGPHDLASDLLTHSRKQVCKEVARTAAQHDDSVAWLIAGEFGRNLVQAFRSLAVLAEMELGNVVGRLVLLDLLPLQMPWTKVSGIVFGSCLPELDRIEPLGPVDLVLFGLKQKFDGVGRISCRCNAKRGWTCFAFGSHFIAVTDADHADRWFHVCGSGWGSG